MYRCRKPRWVSARFFLNGSKASAYVAPVHTSGSRSDGSDPFTIPSKFAAMFLRELAVAVATLSYAKSAIKDYAARYGASPASTAQTVRAFLLAIATATTLGWRRSRILAIHWLF